MIRVRTGIFVLLTVLSVCNSAAAADDVLWERAYGAGGRNYNASAITGGPDGSLFVAGTSAAPGFGGEAPEFWLWKIDKDGELLANSPIARGEAQDRINPSADLVRAIAAHAGGGALIVEFQLGDPYFVRFDSAAKIASVKRLEIPERTYISIARLLPSVRGQYLALGGADGRAFALRLDADGALLSTFTSPTSDFFWDGAVQPNGGFVAVGSLEAKPFEITLSYFDGERPAPRVVTLPGSKPSLASGDEGNVVVVYDRSRDDVPDIRIASIAPNGTVRSDTPVPGVDAVVRTPYQVAHVRGDRYLVAGRTQDGIVALRYERGRIASRLETKRDHVPRHWFLQRVTGEPPAALTIVHTGGMELTTRVGIIRFR